MRNFDSIDLDEAKEEVTIGGGCLTGAVLEMLAGRGWYTCTPNSNAVGMVGGLLGGLNHGTLGLHGIGVDSIGSITVVPFSPQDGEPRALTLSMKSEGEERKLFDVLRGAGHGFGVVMSMTINVYRISDRGMTDNKIWARRLIFPPTALPTATSTYLSLLPDIPPQLSAVLLFMRAPPTAPIPGAPMIMLGLTYFGPKEDAERVCAITFGDDVVSKAIAAPTVLIEWSTMNDAFEPMNRHGGRKEYHGAFVQEVSSGSVSKAYEAWIKFTEKNRKSRAGSYVVIGASNTSKLLSAGSESPIFFPARDRGVFVQASPWYAGAEETEDADEFGRDVVTALREKDSEQGRRGWGFANNWSRGQDAREVYTDAQIEDIHKAKGKWDSAGVGWSPIVEGW